MANLQYAKESIVLEALKLVAENDKRTQSLELGGSVVFKAKSVALGQSLADALHANTKLTALNLSSCNLSDSAIEKLSAPLSHNNVSTRRRDRSPGPQGFAPSPSKTPPRKGGISGLVAARKENFMRGRR